MTARIIDGKVVAQDLQGSIAAEVTRIVDAYSIEPGLAVVLVGEDPASKVYVENKGRQTERSGMRSIQYRLSKDTSTQELLNLVSDLNGDASVHGILVQLPLPDQIDEQRVIEAIDPSKDVDGFHPVNAGGLAIGNPSAVAPCTPLGCLLLLHDQLGKDLSGLHAVVVGRSNIVGKPMAQLLLQANCTVTVSHSRTRNLSEVCRTADILVAAVGRPEMIRGDWVKPGATVIDVGINRINPPSADKAKLIGDVAFDEVVEVADAVTPVPGGVGPMTIACLLRNTLIAAGRQKSIAIDL